MSRCLTWDRWSATSHLYFPARILAFLLSSTYKSLTKSDETFRSVYEKELSRLQLHVVDTDVTPEHWATERQSINFDSNVKSFTINSDGSVVVTVGTSCYLLLTEARGTNRGATSYRKMHAKTFGDISIDHNIPIANIIGDSSSSHDNYPHLSQLSANIDAMIAAFNRDMEFRKMIRMNIRRKNSALKNVEDTTSLSTKNSSMVKTLYETAVTLDRSRISHEDYTRLCAAPDPEFLSGLFREFKIIVSRSEGHTLMQRSENSSKGRKSTKPSVE